MRDRYRPRFCSTQFYIDHQLIFKAWDRLFSKFDQHTELQLWTLGLILLRRPTDWFGGNRKISFSETIKDTGCSYRDSCDDFLLTELIQNTVIQKPHQIDEKITVFELINKLRLKSIPENALQSLYQLSFRKQILTILDEEPHPFDLLRMQSEGKRVITFNKEFKNWPHLVYGERDVLSFILHDLIHAHHFFSDPYSQQKQMGFYRLILKIENDPQFKYLYSDPKFADTFNYIISDMNAHPVHLFQTLKALVQTYPEADKTWNNWSMVWSSDITKQTALHNINTPLFSDLNAYSIESICSYESYKLGLF